MPILLREPIFSNKMRGLLSTFATLVTVSVWVTFLQATLPIDFDWQLYLELNPDVFYHGIRTKDRTIEHYLNYGKNEHRFYRRDSSEKNWLYYFNTLKTKVDSKCSTKNISYPHFSILCNVSKADNFVSGSWHSNSATASNLYSSLYAEHKYELSRNKNVLAAFDSRNSGRTKKVCFVVQLASLSTTTGILKEWHSTSDDFVKCNYRSLCNFFTYLNIIIFTYYTNYE